MDRNQDNLDLPELIANGASHGEAQADALAEQIKVTPEGAKKTRGVIGSFIRSYRDKSPELSNKAWLCREFAKYPNIWQTEEEIEQTAGEIVEEVAVFKSAQQELTEHHSKGLSTNNWLAGKIEQGATAGGVTNFGAYATKIDTAIETANKANIDLLYRNDGQLNQQLNLDGFIAEQHHVDTFNLDAVAKGSEYSAEVLQPKPGQTYGKNSVDIVIKDGEEKIVRRYQAKYGADADATDTMLKKGDYRGQRKLVPEGQSEDIPGSTETIEIDGVESKPLSKQEAKERQRRAQEEAEAKQYDWNETSRIDIAKNIGQKAGAAALLSVGFQGARILGRRIWNGITGKENNSAEEDLQEFVRSSLKSAATSGLTVAVTGGVTVAVKSGWLGNALKNTPAGRIANAVCIGIENAKILCKFAKGEITGAEALDQAGSATCSLVGGLAGGAKGASIGAALGTALGPVGTAIGGVVGGVVGGIAGNTVGEAIYEGGKKIVSTVVDSIKSVGSAISSGVSLVFSGVASLFGF
ncbi:hypothetical protein CGG79_00350 [Vibrio parahaemolyticus]|uniref:hypothetical protein n=2 Tax=Vibrio parahaemolyticus TaxID=670 RepID=UPI0011240C7F|nr:hypothetical protein [Vibrio parahaemolyticus]MBE3774216.1 hypothetical protein [Vibrio parahaemolyticus]TOQ45155.1 hypothetical protein CGG95_09650 [Vibrio parahaemolyticus]TOR37462.1 hypothetical protein CGG79_00350 [Vibrio parahaemolyticus]HCE4559675.1 hypothetical protein [Vibrio parahaemolyticus]HCG5607512.1 hypothetical protein [Vibrio parahaemolyticus]